MKDETPPAPTPAPPPADPEPAPTPAPPTAAVVVHPPPAPLTPAAIFGLRVVKNNLRVMLEKFSQELVGLQSQAGRDVIVQAAGGPELARFETSMKELYDAAGKNVG